MLADAPLRECGRLVCRDASGSGYAMTEWNKDVTTTILPPKTDKRDRGGLTCLSSAVETLVSSAADCACFSWPACQLGLAGWLQKRRPFLGLFYFSGAPIHSEWSMVLFLVMFGVLPQIFVI